MTIARLIECAENRTQRQFTFTGEYAEPGYSDPESGIVFGDWNPSCGFDVPKDVQRRDPVSKLARVLEAKGFELEWEDEWSTCYDCGKAVRTSPDSYSWTAYYRILNECELVCLDCLDAAEYLESIQNNSRHACPPEMDPEEHGYTKFNGEFETGLHPHQDDKPEDVLKTIHAKHPKSLVVFRLASVGQFDATWEAYYKL